jgi:predicted deacetylase
MAVIVTSCLLRQDLHAQSAPPADDEILFIIRVDDILSRNQTFMPSSIIPLQEVAERAGAVVTWAVMPHRLLEGNVNRGQLTRDLLVSVANGHEISLHGYIHLCQQCQSIGGAAFWGHEMFCTVRNRALTYAQQEKLIVDGLKILADSIGVRPVTFIPPGHVSDATTHEVLADYDFHGIAINKPMAALSTNLFNVGTSEDFGWELTPTNYAARRTSQLRDIRERGVAYGIYTMLLHDPFTRPGYRDGLLINWMEEVLDSVKTEFGDRIRFVTLDEAARVMAATNTSITRDDILPQGVILHQNFPNPFNPSTRIQLELDQAETLQLRVYDVRGALVTILADGTYAAGMYNFTFDGGGLSSGVYLYRLDVGGKTLTRTMVLVK